MIEFDKVPNTLGDHHEDLLWLVENVALVAPKSRDRIGPQFTITIIENTV